MVIPGGWVEEFEILRVDLPIRFGKGQRVMPLAFARLRPAARKMSDRYRFASIFALAERKKTAVAPTSEQLPAASFVNAQWIHSVQAHLTINVVASDALKRRGSTVTLRLGKTFSEGLVVEDHLDFVSVLRSGLNFALTVVAAEGHIDASQLDCSVRIQIPATEGASLLGELLGRNQLMVRLDGKFGGILGKLTGAVPAAEIDLSALVVCRLRHVGWLVSNDTFDFLQIDIGCHDRYCRNQKDCESTKNLFDHFSKSPKKWDTRIDSLQQVGADPCHDAVERISSKPKA